MRYGNRIKHCAFHGALLLLGCSYSGGPGAEPQGKLVWPGPPEPARVEFVAAYGEPSDAGIRSGLLDFLLGTRNEERLQVPVAVTTNSNGAMIVADLDGALMLIDPEERLFKVQRRAVGMDLVSPVSVAVGVDDSLYVIDSYHGALFVYSPELEPVRLLLDGLERPAGLVYDEQRQEFFLAEAAVGQILRLSRSGIVLDTLGHPSNDASGLNTPTHLELDGDELLVTDSYHFRIVRMNRLGEFLHAFGTPGQVPGSFARPKGIACDSSANIYVVDALFDNVQIFDPEGRLLLFFGARGGLAGGAFSLPNGIHIDSNNRIYIADTYHGRIQVFQALTPAATSYEENQQ